MIRRGRGGKYTASSGSAGNDTDALQTDVMRFMSILGLCLMAVFALVQSIPRQDTDAVRAELEEQKLQRDIALQQQRAGVLQADLERLTVQTRDTQQRNTLAQQALSSTQQQLTLLVDQTEQTRSERARLTAELEILKHQLAQGHDELSGIQQAAQTGTRSLRDLQEHVSDERQRLDAISQQASALETKPAPSSPASEKRPPPVPPPGQQGFTLRFASTEALEHLVAAGTVSLYAMTGKQAWRLSLGEGKRNFAPDAFPGWFHEMAPATVPPGYARTLESSNGQATPSPLVWGVQLPPATRQGIASLTRGLQGGNLVIGADGQVTLAVE